MSFFTQILNYLALLIGLQSHKELYVTQNVHGRFFLFDVTHHSPWAGCAVMFRERGFTWFIKYTAVDTRLLLVIFKEGSGDILRIAYWRHT
jgi:hypothetical protein